MESGRLFQQVGDVTINARWPNLLCAQGTNSFSANDDRILRPHRIAEIRRRAWCTEVSKGDTELDAFTDGKPVRRLQQWTGVCAPGGTRHNTIKLILNVG